MDFFRRKPSLRQIVGFTEVNNILLQWLCCFFSLRSQTGGKEQRKGFLTVLFPINARSRSLMIWPLLQLKSGWFYFYVLKPWCIRIANSIQSPNQQIWQLFLKSLSQLQCLTTFSASRASQFRTDKVILRFLMISWNQNGLEGISANTITIKWLDCILLRHLGNENVFVFPHRQVVDSVWFNNYMLDLAR